MNEKIPHLTEEQNTLLSLLADARIGIREELEQLFDGYKEATESPSFGVMARQRFQEIKKSFDAHVEGESREYDLGAMFQKLHEYFLACERAEGDTFSLKDAHNAIVRDFENPEFHLQLMAYCMEQAELHPENTEVVRLGMLAKEFDANGMRRRGFHLLAGNDHVQAGTAMIERAKEVFAEVLKHWEEVQDLQSQARVLYEQAHIATETGDFLGASEAQKKSADVARKAGDLAGACIASIKACEAQLKGSLEPPVKLAVQFEQLRDEMILLAEDGNNTAINWVGNAHAHLAEAQEAAGDLDDALVSWKATAADPIIASEDSMRQLRDAAAQNIERLSEEVQ